MIRSSNGRIARNAATVAGASASSKRARKVKPAATISSMRRTLPGRDPVARASPLVVRSCCVAFPSGIVCVSTATR